MITLLFESPEWKAKLPRINSLTKKALMAVLEFEAISASVEVSVVYAHDSFVQDLNATYRGKNKPTNILSFAEYQDRKAVLSVLRSGKEAIYLGDMALAYETIAKEAIQQGKPLQAHVTHLLVHGLLHLLGYDHEKEKEAEQMESKEIAILQTLGIENPYEKN